MKRMLMNTTLSITINTSIMTIDITTAIITNTIIINVFPQLVLCAHDIFYGWPYLNGPSCHIPSSFQVFIIRPDNHDHNYQDQLHDHDDDVQYALYVITIIMIIIIKIKIKIMMFSTPCMCS